MPWLRFVKLRSSPIPPLQAALRPGKRNQLFLLLCTMRADHGR
jgi:hypothetical protein